MSSSVVSASVYWQHHKLLAVRDPEPSHMEQLTCMSQIPKHQAQNGLSTKTLKQSSSMLSSCTWTTWSCHIVALDQVAVVTVLPDASGHGIFSRCHFARGHVHIQLLWCPLRIRLFLGKPDMPDSVLVMPTVTVMLFESLCSAQLSEGHKISIRVLMVCNYDEPLSLLPAD